MKSTDPRDPATKARIKASIAAAIVNEVGGSSLTDVAERVEKEYERLLIGASVVAHIPALTGGRVRHAVREFIKGRVRAAGFSGARTAAA
jgi:hypothetical protein